MSAYYFDVLPVHPCPEPCESLTSYLIRLAEKNGLHQFSSLHKIISASVYSASQLIDYSFAFLKVLAERVNCSESQLLVTTMYHLGKKFNRVNSHTLSSFFKGSLGEYLRYCPLCIAERPYYHLSWRFLSLKGCSVHRCRFLDSCGLCGKPIPLFILPAKIGVCPNCLGDLRYSTIMFLSDKEMEETKYRATDLEYLLSPQLCEQKSNVHRAVMLQLKAIRQDRHISLEQAARDLVVPLNSFKFLEWGHNQKKGWSLKWNQAKFQTYIAYADYLGISLKLLFTHIDALSPNEHEIKLSDKQVLVDCVPSIKFQLREKELYQQVKQAIQILNVCQVEVSLSSISRHLHISVPTFSRYPAVMSLLREITSDSKPQEF